MKLPKGPNGTHVLAMDVECYPNVTLVVVSDGETSTVYTRDRFHDLADVLNDPKLAVAGFNNLCYDDVLLGAIASNPKIAQSELHALSTRLVVDESDDAREENFKAIYCDRPWGLSIDVFQILNKKGSLKEHACKSGAMFVEEAPWPFDRDLPLDKVTAVADYCRQDVENTIHLLRKQWDKVLLREKLAQDYDVGNRIYALSEPGIAQAVFLSLHRERSGEKAAQTRLQAQTHSDNLQQRWPLAQIVSERVYFQTNSYQEVGDAVREGDVRALDSYGGKWELDCPWLGSTNNIAGRTVNLSGKTFAIGVGGLHSVDAPGRYHSTETHAIYDLDVTSYYPSIIIEEGLYPAHIGSGFVDDMRRLRDRRVEAKRKMQALAKEKKDLLSKLASLTNNGKK